MPWQEVIAVELRHQFVQDALRRLVPLAELCAVYDISRKTGYKFLARYRAQGCAGLADRSRRPQHSPAALDPVLLARLLEAGTAIRSPSPTAIAGCSLAARRSPAPNVSQTLGEEYVGLTEIDDAEWDLYFGPLRLGRLHERTLQVEDALGRCYRRPY